MWPFASKEDVRAEVHQLRNEFSQALQAMQQVLTTEIRQRPPIQPPTVTPEILELLQNVSNLQQQVKELAQLISQMSAVTPAGQSKPIDPTIKARINQALLAINALGIEHANWLETHRVSHDEIQSVIEELQQKHQASAHHVFPPEHKDTEPVM